MAKKVTTKKQPEAKEKIELTNGDYWVINNNQTFLEIRKTKMKNGLKFLRWIKTITESVPYKAFTDVWQEKMKDLQEAWKADMVKLHGDDFLKKLGDKADKYFMAYYKSNVGRLEDETEFDAKTGEIEKYSLVGEDLPPLSEQDYRLLERYFEFD